MSEKITTRCPSCHCQTLSIHEGYLFCTWIECKDPTLIDRMGEQPRPVSPSAESKGVSGGAMTLPPTLSLSDYVNHLIARWYESAPYGDQIPQHLPGLFAQFCGKHGMLNEEGMLEAFCTATPEDPMLELFECIFETAATFTIMRMDDAVYDRNKEVLSLINIAPLGTLATPENDPNPKCEHQHIMHPNMGGRMLFVETMSQPQKGQQG